MVFVQKHVSSSFESVLWSNYNISKSCFQLLLGICVSYFENENWPVRAGRDSFKTPLETELSKEPSVFIY